MIKLVIAIGFLATFGLVAIVIVDQVLKQGRKKEQEDQNNNLNNQSKKQN